MLDPGKFTICSDSLSALQSMQAVDLKNPQVVKAITLLDEIQKMGHRINFLWTPAHVGILGNEKADEAAKNGITHEQILFKPIASDLKSLANLYVLKQWQTRWDTCTSNKLHELQPLLKVGKSWSSKLRRDEIVTTHF